MTDTSARHRVAVTSPPLALGTEPNAIAVLFPRSWRIFRSRRCSWTASLLVSGPQSPGWPPQQRTEKQVNLAAVCL